MSNPTDEQKKAAEVAKKKAAALAKKAEAKEKAKAFKAMAKPDKIKSLRADLKTLQDNEVSDKAAIDKKISEMNTAIKNKRKEKDAIDSAINAIKGQIFDLTTP